MTELKDRRIRIVCPKCGGSLFYVDDFNGEYEQCLQCGFIKYPNPPLLDEPKEELVSSEG